MITSLIDKIEVLARKMPAGMPDQKAYQKLRGELAELDEATRLEPGDQAAVLLEAADCVYYAVKAYFSGLITARTRDDTFSLVSSLSGYDLNTIAQACIAKYTLRAQPGNPKDDQAERQAIQHLIK